MNLTLRLETERLILRALTPEDAPRIAELAGAREISLTTMTVPHPYTHDDAVDFINGARHAMIQDEQATFAITLKPQGAMIGCIGVGNDRRHQRGELGYWMGVPYWGKGYTSEAARRVVQFAFEDLGLNRVYASYFTHNPASARVMQKIGMTYEGTLRQHYRRWDEYKDAGFYGIIREEYFRQ